uniref:photosystem I subunit X n=1 Tax=Galdieria phlegrea TaxID=1389228 RepID=UPI0023D88A4B|nr:photosystem I subunit X [Galdieria phlegrea]WDA99849.1 photosystem I subunit X [Galdieria phlegrea]
MLISPTVNIIFIIVNTICLFIARYTTQNKNNKMLVFDKSNNNINLSSIIASMSLGHILSSATVIGLKSLNLIR